MITKEEEFFRKYLPEKSVSYCMNFWKTHKIQFTVSKPRKTVYGNYIFRDGSHHISVNGDLNKEAFLVTYLHEVAHLQVRVNYSERTLPHGSEWQFEFQKIIKPVLTTEIFSAEILTALTNHLKNPNATSCSDPVLHKILMKQSQLEEKEGFFPVEKLPAGSLFRYENQRYEVVRFLRTRIECRNIDSGQVLRFSGLVQVEVLEEVSELKPKAMFPVLAEINLNQRFRLKGNTYILVEKKRTRFLCKEVGSQKMFLMSSSLSVELDGLKTGS